MFVGVVWVFHEPLRSASLSLLRAPFTVASGVVRTLLILPRLPKLAAENASLKAQLTRRSLELAEAREALRRLTAAEALRSPAGSPQGIVASVIQRSPIPGQETILLNRGRQHGLHEEVLLVDAAGLVGHIIDVHPTTSLAMLVTDPNSRVAGVVERSRELGLVLGQGIGLCRFIYLDADADIVEGDRVLTAGLGTVFSKKGLEIGTVISVSRDRQAGSATAVVRPAANLGRLEDVLCLVPSSS